MRRSEFDRAVADEFGPSAPHLVHDLALSALDGRTAERALRDGVLAREVWLALCEETGVPEARRHGVGRLQSRRQ
jgi:hypothetical protein